MHPTLTLASRAAHAAAEKLVYTRENWSRLLEESGYDTTLDQMLQGAAKRVVSTLRNAYPDQTVYFHHHGEAVGGREDTHWQADVLLGRDNFGRGLSDVGVLVGQFQNGKIEQLVLVFPFIGQEAQASRGRGMTLSGRRVRCTGADRLSGIMLGRAGRLEAADRLVSLGAEPRVTGCAMLDLVRAAAGQLDVAVHRDLTELEVTAAQLLATEAGAMTGELSGAPLQRRSTEMMLANPRLFRQILGQLHRSP